MIRAQLAGFYRSTGREAPTGLDMDGLVLMALRDWVRIPDADLPEVCSQARVLAAQKGNFPAGSPEVLHAWREYSEKAYRLRVQRQAEARQAAIDSGKVLANPDLDPPSQEDRRMFCDDLRKKWGIL
jgi:hypothetical protein